MHSLLRAKQVVKYVLVTSVLVLLLRNLLVDWLVRAPKTTVEPVLHIRKQHPRFTPLIDAFKQNYLHAREAGSQLYCTVNGEVVADVVGGRDAQSVFSTSTMIFSSGKVIESLALAMLVDRTEGMDYADSVGKHWPQFGAKFGQEITIAHLMKHRARLGKVERQLKSGGGEEEEEEAVMRVFADAARLEKWVLERGGLHVDLSLDMDQESAYHAVTRGILVDLLISKVDGRRGADFVRQEILAKLDIPHDECGVGGPLRTAVAPCESMNSLLVTAIKTAVFPVARWALAAKMTPEDFAYWFLTPAEFTGNMGMARNKHEMSKYFTLIDNGGDLSMADMANSAVMQQLPLLSASFVCNAKSMARINTELAARAGGVLLSARGLERALEHEGGAKYDFLMKRNVTFTNAGWGNDRFAEGWIGWAGAGGSLNLFNLKHRATIAYVPTMLETRWHKPNGVRILTALRRVLEGGE